MGMLPHEVIRAVTLNAAKALGRSHDRGSLSAGKRADFAVFDISMYQELLYHYGVNHLSQLWIQGQPVLVFETELQPENPFLHSWGMDA